MVINRSAMRQAPVDSWSGAIAQPQAVKTIQVKKKQKNNPGQEIKKTIQVKKKLSGLKKNKTKKQSRSKNKKTIQVKK